MWSGLRAAFIVSFRRLRFEGVMMADFGRLGIFKMQKYSI